jgi:hypothetical protein
MSSANRFFQDHIDDGSLVLWHDYRSGSLRDWSGRGNDGTATAAVQWMNRGLYFPVAGARVDVAAIDLTATNNITVGALISGGFAPTAGARIFVSTSLAGTVGFSLYCLGGPINILSGILNGDVGFTDSETTNAATPVADWNKVSLFACNMDKGAVAAGEVTPYRDGVVAPYATVLANNNTNNFGNQALRIGDDVAGGFISLTTVLSVVLFNRKLTATEHAQMYDAVTRLG